MREICAKIWEKIAIYNELLFSVVDSGPTIESEIQIDAAQSHRIRSRNSSDTICWNLIATVEESNL